MGHLTIYQKLEELNYCQVMISQRNKIEIEQVKFVKNWIEQLSYKERRESYNLYLKTHELDCPDDPKPYRTYQGWLEMEHAFTYGEVEENGGRIFIYPCEV